MKVLSVMLKADNFPIEIYQMGNVVHICGGRIKDYPIPFPTPQEAKAFTLGITWVFRFYGGKVDPDVKEISEF